MAKKKTFASKAHAQIIATASKVAKAAAMAAAEAVIATIVRSLRKTEKNTQKNVAKTKPVRRGKSAREMSRKKRI
jgi:hypothetical protein